MRSGGRIFALTGGMLALVAVACAGSAAAAADDLYQARTILTGQMVENRLAGFARGLADVLVKVSGDPRLMNDSRTAALSERASTFVTGFRYRDLMGHLPVRDEQGTRDRPYELTIQFDPEKIDAALRSLDRQPWTAARPRVVLLLGVRQGPVAYTLTSDGERGFAMRQSLSEAAWRVGIPLVLPTEAQVVAAGLSPEKPPPADLAALDAAGKAAGGEVALAGQLVWSDAALGWTGDWRLDAQGKSYAWQVRGVTFDDAFRNATRGAVQVLSGHGQPE